MTVTPLRPPRPTIPRTYLLIREVDHSGSSGIGTVAEGTEWSDGSHSLRWRGEDPCTQSWEQGLRSVLKVHGHGGSTYAVFFDDPETKIVFRDGQLRMEQYTPRTGRVLSVGRETK
jgi:hypothetical protein